MNSVFQKKYCNLIKCGNVQTLGKNVSREECTEVRLGTQNPNQTTLEFDCKNSGLQLLKHVVVREAFP